MAVLNPGTSSPTKKEQLIPMLPQPIQAKSAEPLFSDDGWAMSEKLDGQRLIVRSLSHAIVGYNRQGLKTSIPSDIHEGFYDIPVGWTFDGELVNGTYHVFDIIEAKSKSLLNVPFEKRYSLLVSVMDRKTYGMKKVPHFSTESGKTGLFTRLLKNKAEGVVFKMLKAPYASGRTGNILKYKFVKDVDAVILEKGVDGKDAMRLGVFKDGDIFDIGKCSTLTGDGPESKVGDVVSVQCLYATASGKLYQPVTPLIRTDKAPEECTYTQIEDIQLPKGKDE